MDFDRVTTGVAFVIVVAIATGVTVTTPMDTSTVLMMVLPSIVVFGLVVLALGVKHGEYRSSR